MPWGYHCSTSSCDSVSVCLPMASPVAMPARQPRIRSAKVTLAGMFVLVVDVKVKHNSLDVPWRTRTVRAGHDFKLRVIRPDESGDRLVNERRDVVGLSIAADLTN